MREAWRAVGLRPSVRGMRWCYYVAMGDVCVHVRIGCGVDGVGIWSSPRAFFVSDRVCVRTV
eukprot:6211459-Pleurochrysis_carterae.AAC.3